MKSIRANGRAPGLRVLVVVPALLLSACVIDGQQSQSRQGITSVASAQPRMARYGCEGGGSITVEAMTAAVRLSEAEGDSYDLPASPPNQATRFGEGGYALVVEGREALWMKAGKEPMTCRR